MPQEALRPVADDEVDLFAVWMTLWRSRWLVIGITGLFAVASVTYALLAPAWYRASVLLSPVKQESPVGLVGQLGGLASLAGINPVETGTVEAVAVLQSRDFARAFIEDEALLPVFFADDWDAEAGSWTVEDPPDIRQAVRYFDTTIREVTEDRRTGLVTLAIEWKDPALAAKWANTLALRLNDHLRQRALAEAEANVKYLRQELESTSVVVLQQSISRLLEIEMQKLMLARGNEEFAFRIIDRAEVPRLKSKPRRKLVVMLGVLIGGMLSAFMALVGEAVRNRIHAQV